MKDAPRTSVRVGLLLAGCSPLDGSDPVQALAAAIAASEAGAEVVALAPDVPQHDAFDPLTGKLVDPPPSALAESARLLRGACRPADSVSAHEMDTLFIPGGLGVVKTLCDFAVHGTKASLLPQIQTLLAALVDQGRPVGAVGEGSLLLALSRRGQGLKLAAGTDPVLREGLKVLGQEAVTGNPAVVVVDEETRVATSAGDGGGDLGLAAAAARSVLEQLLRWLTLREAEGPDRP